MRIRKLPRLPIAANLSPRPSHNLGLFPPPSCRGIACGLAACSGPPSPGGGGSARRARRGGVKATDAAVAVRLSPPPARADARSTSPLQGEVKRKLRHRSAKCDSSAFIAASLRGLNLERAGAGAAEAVGAVHVLDIGLRHHIAA